MSPMYFRQAIKKDNVYCQVIPVSDCPAKTIAVYQNGKLEILEGCNVPAHLKTTCLILRMLAKLWDGYPLQQMIYPAAEWLAAYHDIGKVTPAFVTKIYDALHREPLWNPPVRETPGDGGHARNSEIILQEFGRTFARLAGCHHGGSWWRLGLTDQLTKPELGGPEWQTMRKQLLEDLRAELQLPECDLKKLPKEQQPLILGSVILADWLSSGMDLGKESPTPDAAQLQKTIRQAGLVPEPWKTGISFSDLFGFPENSLQKACCGQARRGCLYIIEAGMGSGKTEAALYLAHQLLEKKEANGLYFAMPTRLTSEKIHERLNRFLEAGLANPNDSKAMLIHGEAWLNWVLEQPDENGGSHQNPDSWFQSKKRALLAPFGAGTVDQALLSVINVKHRDLRAFALAGKVLILDECHSYDCYTGSLIAALVRQVRNWGGTVIILSATLTTEVRKRLIGTAAEDRQFSQAYPLLTVVSDEKQQIAEFPVEPEKSRRVLLRHTDDKASAMLEALEHARRGEQVLWIENTVADAQQVYCQLQTAASGIELGLIHSRFPAGIRREQESRWVDLLGKNGAENRKKCGRILCSTQIMEQSIDADADFLISRLAPGDMIFQRIGRLWRHEFLNPVRPESAKREALLLIPPDCGDPEKILQTPEVFLPYEPYWMLRTYEVWKTRSEIILPDDIRPMLEEIYCERDENGKMQNQKLKMQMQKDNLERLAGIAQGIADRPSDDEQVSTRINGHETVQVLLLRKGNGGIPLNEKLFPVFDGAEPVPVPDRGASRRDKAAAAAALMKNMITVAEKHAPKYEDFPLDDFLRHILWTGEPDNRPIRAAYVDGSGELLNRSGVSAAEKEILSYHKNLGYCARKKEV